MKNKNPLLKVTTPSKELRKKSREALNGKWFKAMLFLIVWGIFAGIISAGVNYISASSGTLLLPGLPVSGMDTAFAVGSVATGTRTVGIVFILLVDIVAFIFASALTMGVSTYFLKIAKGKPASVGDLFAAFREGAVFKSAGLAFVQGFFIFLWSLLFVIPGIIAAFRYSQAFYVLAETPYKSISQCMNKSKELMSVNKAKLFCLNLSLIGWWLLTILAGVVVMTVFILVFASGSIAMFAQLSGDMTNETLAYVGAQILTFIVCVIAGSLITSLLFLPVEVYQHTVNAVFYRTVQAKRAQAVRNSSETELLLAAQDEKYESENSDFAEDETEFDEEYDDLY